MGIMLTETELALEQSQQGRNRVNTYAVRITKMLSDIEDSHHGPIDAMHNPSQLCMLLSKEVCFISHGVQHASIDFLILRS
ncbi:hypothetical protein Tco_1088513 [Tanacetum coccineum]